MSADRAWVIGQAGTPGKCDNKDPYICTSIARTDDDGQSWQGVHAPDTGSPSGATGVGGIRFLNDTQGWAFGPELWATDDGGNTWIQVDTKGARVTDLETSGGRAYALFATCSNPTGGASSYFAADCTSYTLMTATTDGGTWTPVGPATTRLADGGAATSAVLQLTGTNGYLLAPDGVLYSGSIGGTWSQVGTSICKPGPAQANGLPSAAQLALADPTELWIACNGTSASDPPVMVTSDRRRPVLDPTAGRVLVRRRQPQRLRRHHVAGGGAERCAHPGHHHRDLRAVGRRQRLEAQQRDRRRRAQGGLQLRRHDNRRPGRRRARRHLAARGLDDRRRRLHLGAGDVDHARQLGLRRRAAGCRGEDFTRRHLVLDRQGEDELQRPLQRPVFGILSLSPCREPLTDDAD